MVGMPIAGPLDEVAACSTALREHVDTLEHYIPID
jgi:hypothetical protein